MDNPKKKILSLTRIHFDVPEINDVSDVIGEQMLDEFITTPNILKMYATMVSENQKRIKFYFDVCIAIRVNCTSNVYLQIYHQYEKLLVIYKIKANKLTNENLLSTIQVTTVNGSPTVTLYHNLQNVFSPLFVKQERRSASHTNIQRQLASLQAGLQNSLLSPDHYSLGDVDANSLTVILSLEHEVDYWTNVANISKGKERQSSTTFRDILQPLARDFSVLDALPLSDVEDLLENAHNILDDLWHSDPPYAKIRMQYLMDLIATDIVKCVSKNLTGVSVWTMQYNSVSELLQQCMTVVNHWASSCKQLTQIFWPNYSMHTWSGDPYVPQNLVNLANRLQEILDIRTIHRQLVCLLTSSEEKELNTNLIYEFKRYAELINRPVLKKTLLSERQCLLTLLKDHLNQLHDQLSAEVSSGLIKYDTPEVINEILKVKQLESKASEVKNISEKILNDLEGFDELTLVIMQLLKDIKQQHTELFDSWVNGVMLKIKDKTLSLQGTDQVIEFSKNKLMKVNYSPDLVTLIQEVRQLMVLGYHVPSNIEDAANYAKKFMKHANILQQIANFHNTIGDRMIPSQRPMMLASALNLAKLVQEQEVVSWDNIERVEQYIKNLQIAVEKLSNENNLLATYHFQIMDKISALNDTDLIKYFHCWKETTKNLREIIIQIENKGFQSLRLWKTEIDHQLYIVLEKQYLKSLDTLHLYLPEIHADLIYRDSQLQLSPDAKSLREKYHQQLKQFLDIPKTFRGVNSSKENVFLPIIENNKNDLDKVNQHADDLITQLNGVVKHWQSWLTLGTLDTSQLSSWEHWELHFRASKTFGQEIAKLPSTEERVGCFIIGLSWLRSDLESHNRSYWSLLSLSLKDSIAQDVFKLQQYVDTSTATLNQQPLTLDQISETDASYSDILNQKDQMESLYKEMMNKTQILGSWTRDRVDSVYRLKAAWERLQSLLDNYEHIISKRMETMKITLKVACENLQNDIERFGAKWEQIKFKSQSGEMIGESVNRWQKHLQDIKDKRQHLQDLTAQFESYGNEEWIVFRKKSYRFDEFLSNWENKLERSSNNSVITLLLQEIQKYRAVVPVLKYVRGEDFTENHWMEVFSLLGVLPKPIDLVLLNDFLQKPEALLDNAEKLQVICKRAASEVVVRQAIGELDHWDVQCRFLFSEHKDVHNKKVFIIRDFKEILNKIGDNQSLLQSVKNAADYGSFSERAEMWETRLADLEEHLTSLAQIQRKWIYLEPIFGGGALVQERGRFERLDKDFKHLLAYVERDPKVTSLNRYPNLKNTLINLQEQLSRNKFPRFLFLGDDDLLEIVGQCSKEQVIQSHLKKLFSGIHSINLDSEGKKIVAMCSLQGETVLLNNLVNIDQPVEDWLNILVCEMQNCLKNLLSQCLRDGDNADPLKYPSQILCLADNLTFTTKCEQAIVNMTLKPLLVNYKTQLNHYSSLYFNESTDNSLSSLDDQYSNLIEIKLKALILDTIHHISVIEELLKTNVVKVDDWNWQKQLRYYSDGSGNVKIKMVNAEMDYSFEYLGNQPKLVRTPLTDKCFLTLLQAMHLGMGGNPYGPAGTGKTESVKALGSLLGRQVLVFNCDEGIDGASMGKILSGLARCGAWGCFDEFNRLDEATLSAVSMYIQPIQNALRMNFDTLTLLDHQVYFEFNFVQKTKINLQIDLNKHCGIFITLNPAGGNYGGRNKLPDSLKQLFRPVVMSHPDEEQIATTLLYCDGYKYASLISQKFIEIFSSARKLLSIQQHYDWGLRSIKTVLGNCGKTIKSFYKNGVNVTYETELQLAVSSLRVDILSKLTYADRIKFDALIQDVFPKTSVENFGEDAFIAALKVTFKSLNLEENSRQIEKCIELQQQLQQRMGVVLVGPPNSGKSTLRTLLFNTLIHMGKNLKQHVFNPKSMPRVQLLGQIDVDSRQWTDGSLDVHSWIVCDGDMDPEWVESLNSVLDDNKLLSLPSGWHIQFGPNSNFIFETHDLSYVSPATISRLGIIYLSEEDLDVSNVLAKFALKMNTSAWENYGQEYFCKALEWITNDTELLTTTSQISIALTGLSQLSDASTKTEIFIGILNGLGGYLSLASRQMFTENLSNWMGQMQPSTLFFYYNKDKDVVDVYDDREITSAASTDNNMPLILTSQIRYTITCLRTWLQRENEQHFLLVGPRGSAKNLILDYLVKERSDIELITIHCSANLSPQYVIQKLTQCCIIVNSSKGRMYKPKKGHLVLYFKNTQLLRNDSWGSNMLISFLQQFISYNGLFDHNLEWIGVEHVTVVCSTTNSSNLSSRFISSMRIYHVNLPQEEDINAIYTIYLTSIINRHFTKFTNWSNKKTNKITEMLLNLYSLILLYEALRLFEDRLINDDHRRQFEDIVNDLMKVHWNNPNALTIFSDHLYATLSNNDLLVKLTLKEWSDVIQKTIIQCEREGNALDILLTSEVLQLTSKIGKALSEPGGSVLLIGTSGVGRKSSIQLISTLLSANLISPIFLNWSQFNIDLKMVTAHFKIPGLYSTSELESLVVGLKDQMEQENYEGSLTDFFTKRVQKRLHLIVCLENNNTKFSEIITNCPALYNKCKVIWTSEWSIETLDCVPQMLIEKYAGVSKLTDARNVVAELKTKAKEQEEQLSNKQEKANTALDMISSTMKNANSQKNEMEKLKQQTEKESVHLNKRKKEIEEELKEVKPLIEAARAAISNIKAESLSEIRSLRAPPDVIRDILEGVLRLMGTQDTSWNSMKNFLSKRGVKEDIRSFDASRITSENREAVRRLISNRGDSFDPKNAKRASVAAAPLAAWVIANVRYSSVLENIKPLEREQNKLKQNLASAELQLHELSSGLVDVDTAVAKLKTQLSTYTKEAAEIEIHLRAAQSTIATAEGLVNKLNDEYERWKTQLICRFILNEWLEAISLDGFSLEQFLSTEREQLQWQSEGLPADQLSLQNAIMIFNTNITPLLLDPTSIASNWIKTRLNSKTMEVTTQNSTKFNTTLELAVRFGKILIIEEVEAISPVLFTILRKQFVYQGERKLVNVNGKLIDYHDDFKLLLCCRNAHLQLPADLSAVVNVVNFTTTPEGLSEQLLMSAIKQESPELENRHKELLRQREELQEKQYNLQNQLLEDLANASGDILQNNNLMESLNETKASSLAISKALVESDTLQQALQEEYNVYKDISSFASSLYFAIKEFSGTNVLYSLSVPAYIRLFLKSIPEMKEIDPKYGFLKKTLIQAVYSYMSRSIFTTDRIKFALHLCHKILPQQIPNDEWNFFLGNSFLNKSDLDKNENVPKWVSSSLKQKLLLLQYNLPKLYMKLQLDKESLWKKFLEIDDCEVNFPAHCDLTEFQKVITVQLLRRSRLYSVMNQCVLNLTSLNSLNSEIIQVSSIYKETIASEPVLFVTTPGTDPSIEIRDFAFTKIAKEDYIEISMGEGQEAKAFNALLDAAKNGHWLVLKNLHLVTSWLPILCQNFKSIQPHNSFRLWLITEPHKLFSPVLADCSLKIAYEVPAGVKNNLLRTYSSWGLDYVEKLNPNGARLFFILASIHALLQERRTYIPQGWSKMYEFNDTDFSTAVQLTATLWQTNNVKIQWKFLKGICLDSVYGGRIENVQDLNILESYLTQYLVDESLSNRWKPFNLDTSLPTYSNFQEYLNVIKQLSDQNLPRYFGLPENIQKAWDITASSNIILDLRNISLNKNASDTFSQEELYKKITPFMVLWKKLNHGYDFIRASTTPIPSAHKSVFTSFVSEEYYYAITLVKKIHKSFSVLNKILKSNSGADSKHLQLAHELMAYQTPKMWQGFWKGSEDPSNYLKSVIYKTIEISTWNTNPDLFLKKPINLSLLFRAETFLFTFKQNYARKTEIPMDDLVLKSTWKQSTVADAITITNLFIEGAILEGSTLEDCLSNSDNVNSAPACYLSWTQKSKIEDDEKAISVPLFNSKNREEIVAHLQYNNDEFIVISKEGILLLDILCG
ncbi:hypothetical protein RN001_003961 [Aquatica leii]|uniref:Cytoplasmic dynein 2 heavy chain 1 n=1 Tax=Aquatica leii TaxID=1421715 RepID=A0AAN7QC24_9COLE|nr:hypothetical protein RN001_003961 [Aquatica leii]